MLTLYHFGPVANSLTPLLCLLEKGADFENRVLDSSRWEHHDPAFRAVNPEGMVPVLVHDGLIVRESTVINEYLEDILPDPPLRPSDPWRRAEMRVLTKYVDEYFCPALTVLGAHGAAPSASKIDKAVMAQRLAKMPNEEVRLKWAKISETGFSEAELADARRRLDNCIARLDTLLDDGREWLMGADYTLADIKWYSMASALPRVLPEACNADAAPAITAWLARMAERPAVAALPGYAPRR
ncbi:glutathione S-transferase family protein [Altererythrobacter salegens]|uniref:Glutathione S-transferase family protein n=1 Tax=Croceibacterium salegens TaxID=1737568 RepID=A0A6I4SUX8_9SPHN|nr:glutathione S-transferase family protein [Croceibacterium salegens]MXO59711.1 glutathione S-transferase family protein [Croceibacterium salegens]